MELSEGETTSYRASRHLGQVEQELIKVEDELVT
jgi:hypothetical protein